MERCFLKVLSSKENLTEIRDLVAHGDGRIDIVTPWMTRTVVDAVVQRLSSRAEVFVTFRWPTKDDSADFYDIGFIQKLRTRDRTAVQWIDSSHPLHAKVYLVESRGALVTSANLTNYGFPSSDQAPFNRELGLLTLDPNAMDTIAGIIESWDPHALTDSDVQSLQEWISEQKAWVEEHKAVLASRPNPKPSPERVDNPATQALSLSVQQGLIRAYEHQAHGMGRKAYLLNLNSHRSSYPVRLHTSVRDSNPPHGLIDNYHFDLSAEDVDRWRRKAKPNINGVVLIPVIERSDGGRQFDPESTPLAFIPFSELFRRDRFSITPFVRSRGQKPPVLFLSQRSDKKWVLRIPADKRKEMDASVFTNKASRMKNSAIGWRAGT